MSTTRRLEQAWGTIRQQEGDVDQQIGTVRTVIDLRGDRPVVQRILDLAGPGSDPGWIAGLLNREGYPSPTHRPWSPEDVQAVISARRPSA